MPGELDIAMKMVGKIPIPTLFKIEYTAELSFKGLSDVLVSIFHGSLTPLVKCLLSRE